MDIKGKVQSLVGTYGTNDPFQLCKELDILVVFENLKGVLGYCDSHFRMRTIHINSCAPFSLQKFICAHELGHALLHPKINVPFLKANTFVSTDRIERQANTFAVELLMPDDVLMEYNLLDLYNIAKARGIPSGLEELKLINFR